MTKITKGQTVFQACTNFSRHGDTVEMRVISRVVDSCGKTQMTFLDRGHDSIFGKRAFPVGHEHSNVYATERMAFAALAAHTRKAVVLVTYPTVVSDAEWVPSSIK